MFSPNSSSGGGGGGGGGSGGGGSYGRGPRVPGRSMNGAAGEEEPRAHFFVVMDDGIHDVPAAATVGEGEGWVAKRPGFVSNPY